MITVMHIAQVEAWYNLISLNILAVTTVSFQHPLLQERESTGYVNVCVRKDSDTLEDFSVTVETLPGTAQGERMGNLYIPSLWYQGCNSYNIAVTSFFHKKT